MEKERKDDSFIKQPYFQGGEKALKDFVNMNLMYPEMARVNNIEGDVSLRYEINHKGDVTDVKIIGGLDPSCDEEATRVVKLLKLFVKLQGKYGHRPRPQPPAHKLPRGLLWRRFVVLAIGILAVLWRSTLLRARYQGLDKQLRVAHEWKALFERLGGVFIKFGQFTAVRTDQLPWEVCQVFATLLDQANPVPTGQVIAVIEAELQHPLDEVFSEFDPVPAAAGSFGQVHFARLRDGDKSVAVKVQRPGIGARVEVDVALIVVFSQVFTTQKPLSFIHDMNIAPKPIEVKRYRGWQPRFPPAIIGAMIEAEVSIATVAEPCATRTSSPHPAQQHQIDAVTLRQLLHRATHARAAQSQAKGTTGTRDEDDHPRRLQRRTHSCSSFFKPKPRCLASTHSEITAPMKSAMFLCPMKTTQARTALKPS